MAVPAPGSLPNQVSVAITRWRSVSASDHSSPTDASTAPAGIVAARPSVAAQDCSKAAHAARRPSGSSASRSSRPGNRRFSSVSTSGTTSTPLTSRLLPPSSSHGESISIPETSLPRTTTSPRSQPMNRDSRRLRLLKVLPCRPSGWLLLMMQSWHSACTDPQHEECTAAANRRGSSASRSRRGTIAAIPGPRR